MEPIPSVKVTKHRYDFDNVIDRSGTDATKIEGLDRVFGRHDLTPLWVADLDFAVCPEITAALVHRLQHPILGYCEPSEAYWQSIINWLRHRHSFGVDRREITFIPGVVKGIGLYINFFTRPGDKILIQPPVYHPFRTAIEGNGRVAVENPLILEDGAYCMDLAGLKETVEREKPVMMILCNPHNPIGIQWDDSTLAEVARIARRNGMMVVSDEIHGDLMLDGRRHVSFLQAGDDAVAVGAVLGAPSKTFNIPGLVSSWTIIKNPDLRDRFYKWLEANEFDAPTMIGMLGAEAAYNHGEDWLDQMLEYVQNNIDFVIDYCRKYIPEVEVIRPQASFLLWLDFRRLHLRQNEIMDMLLDKAHLALNDGSMFGRQGVGFARLNIGTPRPILVQALESLRTAVEQCVKC